MICFWPHRRMYPQIIPRLNGTLRHNLDINNLDITKTLEHITRLYNTEQCITIIEHLHSKNRLVYQIHKMYNYVIYRNSKKL